MAITKLAHLKESKTGPVHRHLKHALSYILNPDKTEGGIWTGGSITPDPSEALRIMLDTKEEFGKTYGRQGYHFVISFSPGECEEKTAFLLGRDFCEVFWQRVPVCVCRTQRPGAHALPHRFQLRLLHRRKKVPV